METLFAKRKFGVTSLIIEINGIDRWTRLKFNKNHFTCSPQCKREYGKSSVFTLVLDIQRHKSHINARNYPAARNRALLASPIYSNFENCRQRNLTVRKHQNHSYNVWCCTAHTRSFARSLSALCFYIMSKNTNVRHTRRDENCGWHEYQRHSTHLLAQCERYWCRKPLTRFSSVSTIEWHVSLPSVRSQHIFDKLNQNTEKKQLLQHSVELRTTK